MSIHYAFIGGEEGPWAIQGITTLVGDPIEQVSRIRVVNGSAPQLDARTSLWKLRGFTSNLRYTENAEIGKLRIQQEGLNRPQATCAALIPIKKNAAWWAMAQDERRAIFEAQSHHIQIGMDYLPQIARQLHHSRDLGEPFDFLTWFEFAPEHTDVFNHMLARLRASPEWRYVEREVDIRLTRNL